MDEELRNQDAYSLEQWDDQQATFAAISDGHSGKMYWRSKDGSKFAVQAFKELVERQFLGLIRDPDKDPERLKSGWEQIGRDLRTKWLELCAEHLFHHPFTEEENKKAVNEYPNVIVSPAIVYGTNISGALLFQNYGFFVHLGAGDICGCDPDGNAESIFKEHEQRATGTDLMCQPSAHRLIRTKVIEGNSWKQRRMIILATDGAGNDFEADDVSIQDHAKKYLNLWREIGADSTRTPLLEGKMRQLADAGGGKRTLLLLKRVEMEDHLTRGEFESSWVAFEEWVREQEARSTQSIEQTSSQISAQVDQSSKAAIEQVNQSSKAAIEQVEHLKRQVQSFSQITNRLLVLEQFVTKAKLFGTGFLAVLIVVLLGWWVVTATDIDVATIILVILLLTLAILLVFIPERPGQKVMRRPSYPAEAESGATSSGQTERDVEKPAGDTDAIDPQAEPGATGAMGATGATGPPDSHRG